MGFFCVQFVSLVISCFQVALCSRWDVQYPSRVKGLLSSCAVIPCSFNYPRSGDRRNKITGIWYRDLPVGGITVSHSDPNQTVSPVYSGRAEIVGDLNQLNCTCKIRNLGARDKAKYFFRFEVTNVDSWTDSKGVYLNVSEHLERPTVEAITDVLELQPVSATCSTPYSCPDNPTQLRWLGYNATNSSSLEGGSGLEGTVYRTLSFLASHLEHNLVLTCVARVEKLDLSSRKEIRLRVKHTPKDVRVLVFPTAKDLREGNPITLFCDTSRSEPIVTSYKWYKDGVYLGSGRMLQFGSIQPQDNGQYHCSPGNVLGHVDSQNISLTVLRNDHIQANPWKTATLGILGTLCVFLCVGIGLCVATRCFRKRAILGKFRFRGRKLDDIDYSYRSWSFYDLQFNKKNSKEENDDDSLLVIRNLGCQPGTPKTTKEDNDLVDLFIEKGASNVPEQDENHHYEVLDF